MELEKVLLSRKSCREFKDTPVESEKLEKVITAGSLAPVGLPRDGRPHLSVITDKEILDTINGAFGEDKNVIYKAPVLIVVSCPRSAPGIPEMNAACVVEMMSLMATDLGLSNIYLYGACMAIQKNPALAEKIGIPERHTPLSALAVGYGVEPVAECKEFTPILTRNDV